jgi:hypothetical protein
MTNRNISKAVVMSKDVDQTTQKIAEDLGLRLIFSSPW